MFTNSFSAPHRSSFLQNGVTPWYLAGGISRSSCVSAYQPKGAASLAASYINLVTPGVYDAYLGVAPIWTSADGWQSTGTQYLKTDIILKSGMSVFVRFSNVGNGGPLFGAYAGGGRRMEIIPVDGASVFYASGGTRWVSPQKTSGVLGIAGQQGYRDGVADGATLSAWSGDAIAAYILQRNGAAAAMLAKIQAIAFYSTVLTAPQALALSTAMSAI